MGLGFKKDKFFPDLLTEMAKASLISNRMFSMDYSGIKGAISSRMMIGDFHHDIVDSKDDFTWKNVPVDSRYWQVDIEEMKFND